MLCRMRVGVEVGGTFTDLVSIEDGKVQTAKVPSTPDAPDRGAFDALRAWNGALPQVTDLAHGSTVATNAVLERKGARVLLLVSAGMRSIYDLYYRKPSPLVARGDTLEVDERLGPNGEVVRPLDEGGVREMLRTALDGGDFGAVAIAFINSYANASHEHRVAELAREAGWQGAISCSADIIPVFREYERFSTTAMSAYVQPVIAAYLRRFEDRLRDEGFAGHFSVMQSNGGRLPANVMGDNAITALFSGPAAGVVGATRLCARSGYGDLITFDMGGTSTDVCLVEDGAPQLVGETEVDGLPVKTPVLDIVTVGAGGGSIVWVDDGDMLRVGPESAGAAPGPACYGRGGTRPTITDAHVVRGTVRAGAFLGGAMSIDRAAAEQAMEPVAKHLGVSVEEAADAAIRVAESNIVRAIQRVSTERGKDPRGHALVPFGGAGPMQAVRVAEELGLARVVVPPHAGVLSALGLLASDYVHYESLTHRVRLTDEAMPELGDVASRLRDRVATFFAKMGHDEVVFTFAYEMRYVTQAFEIPVAIDDDLALAPQADRIAAQFHAAHERVFEYSSEGAHACEIVSLRVGGAVSPGAIPSLAPDVVAGGDAEPVELFEQGQRWTGVCCSRGAITGVLTGPAIIEDTTSTVYVPSGWRAAHDEHFNLIIEREKI
jgi:N-methylhydantoinase A